MRVIDGCCLPDVRVLAPTLFNVAIDWILSHLAPSVGINVGPHQLTDLAGADDAVIFMSDEQQANDALQNFSAKAAPFGLEVSWAKTEVQNPGPGQPARMLTMNGTQVEGVEELFYLGSKQSSDGYCLPDVRRRIGLASAVITSLRPIWKCSHISLRTKVHLYRALVMSVLKHGHCW